MHDLTDLVSKAQEYPNLLASTVRQYQIQHHLDDHAMVAYLDLANIHRLHLLCLCERPSPEVPNVFITDIGRIVGYIRCHPNAFIRVVLGSPIHLVWQQDPTREMWTCTVTAQRGTFQAAVAHVGTTMSVYTGYIDDPTGRTWLSEQYASLQTAQYACEQLLDVRILSSATENTSQD